MLRTARENLLAIWPETTFSKEFFGHTLLRRSLFICNSPDTVRQVFVDDAANFERKSPQQRHALRPLIGDGLFISDGDVWRERRRAVAPLTHVSRLPELAPAMTQAATERRDLWVRCTGQEIDVLGHMAEMTADVICRTIFGSQLGHAAARTVVTAFSEYQALIGQMDLLSLLGLPDMIPRLHGRRIRASAERIQTVVSNLMTDILKGARKDEPSLIRSLSDPASGHALSAEAVRNEASVLFMAGHETTANTLAWAWFLLSQDPETEARLHAEVDQLAGQPATYADLPALRFTRAVIEETLRLFPPVPIQAREAREARTIAEREVPAGAIVMLVPWLLHRHKLLWDQPDSFIPDRFMPGGSGVPSRYAYVPFSIGPRICTGAAFGLTEAVLCLATLAQTVRLTLRPGWPVMPVCRLTLRPGERLPMRIEPRLPLAGKGLAA
ncbi:MAG: cytochrome P450 [Rhodospirillales bacterium 20-64-7]|nr:MAG: cytochrome P450 [Rhodospirillales bacterium 20-64-7]